MPAPGQREATAAPARNPGAGRWASRAAPPGRGPGPARPSIQPHARQSPRARWAATNSRTSSSAVCRRRRPAPPASSPTAGERTGGGEPADGPLGGGPRRGGERDEGSCRRRGLSAVHEEGARRGGTEGGTERGHGGGTETEGHRDRAESAVRGLLRAWSRPRVHRPRDDAASEPARASLAASEPMQHRRLRRRGWAPSLSPQHALLSGLDPSLSRNPLSTSALDAGGGPGRAGRQGRGGSEHPTDSESPSPSGRCPMCVCVCI